MKNNYVLIDYENVQPKNLKLLLNHEVSVRVFVGEKLAKVPFELASAMQALGGKAEYIQIIGNGPNALDFHIAFYMGKISAEDPQAYFHIISKDKGFDPLIAHLKTKGILSMRERDITEIPFIKIKSTSKAERAAEYIEYLKARGNKPNRLVSLRNSIKNYFRNMVPDEELSELLDELVHRKVVVVNETKVSYKLPG